MKDLASAYLTLPAFEKRTFTLVLAFNQPATRSELVRVLQACDVRAPDGRALSPQKLLPFLEHWERERLVTSSEGQWSIEPNGLHALAQTATQQGMLAEAAETLRRVYPARYGVRKALARELFLNLYLEAPPTMAADLRSACMSSDELAQLLLVAYGPSIPARGLEQAGEERASAYLGAALQRAHAELAALGEGALAYVEAHGPTSERSAAAALRASTAVYLAMRGEPERAERLLDEASADTLAALAFVAMTRGDLGAARHHARTAVERTRTKGSKRIKGLLQPSLWPWLTLLLVTDQDDPLACALGSEQLAICVGRYREQDCLLRTLDLIRRQLAGTTAPITSTGALAQLTADEGRTWIELAIGRVALHASQVTPGSLYEARRARELRRATASSCAWVAHMLEDGAQSFVRLEPPWQRALRSLDQALDRVAPGAAPTTGKAERLTWVLHLVEGRPSLQPRLQVRKGASFSSGRAVSLKRLLEAGPEDPLLDEHDRRVCAHLVEQRVIMSGWPQTYVDFLPQAALALIGHPRVFADTECAQPLSVERGEPSVQVRATSPHGWVVQVEPLGCATQQVYGERAGEDRARLYALTTPQREVVELLPATGLVLPPEAREVAQRTLGKLAGLFPISSSLELEAARLLEVDADPRIHIQLRRMTNGLRVSFSVAPLGTSTRLLPGEGNAVALGTRDGTQVRCTRDLERERRELRELQHALSLGDEAVLSVPTLLESLELITALHALGDRVVVEWPQADPLSIVATRDVDQLKVRVGQEDAWLSAQGELPVDDALTLSFHALLARTHARHGRFVALDGGRFVALSAALQRTIENLEAMARIEGERVVLHPLALLALGDLSLDASAELRERLQRAREAGTLEPPVPATFEATLRPYQRDGFTFLSRLAHWQAGACLADDMGLGKTLQTLALLVARAEGGPALVVAPTSVCSNWHEEARKFAPTLRVRHLGSDRARVLDGLGPFDVLVCSYGVLQQERERLAEMLFHTAVLDEAQAIKNAQTRRARAAFAIRARQRVALTGTPVENHLGELWSVMHFLNPGLLGSEREFEQRFARPIQRGDDRTRAQQLRRLTSPFVLRRKKSEVLDDLPEKTVITLRIAPSADERALYRALREQALARIHDRAQPAQARMQLFAELTRLRRAACHPALVVPERELASSKLAALEELIVELRESGHRALLFSQFVDHLQLVRARLDALDVRYQYLDGSSSAAARSAATRAFQAGEGELFLISLKAGGFGLNLTAADYVIHLDPWWNPAVEDQASDRAHRIGQTRPVTIYRLIMQGSIEEKILALHASKRELADSVLAGESRGVLDVDQLLDLLADAHAPRPVEASAEPSRVLGA